MKPEEAAEEDLKDLPEFGPDERQSVFAKAIPEIKEYMAGRGQTPGFISMKGFLHRSWIWVTCRRSVRKYFQDFRMLTKSLVSI